MKILLVIIFLFAPFIASANVIVLLSCSQIADTKIGSIVTVQLPGPALVFHNCNSSKDIFREGVRGDGRGNFKGATSTLELNQDRSAYTLKYIITGTDAKIEFAMTDCRTGGTTSEPVLPKTCH
jgi:hypothetical protein